VNVFAPLVDTLHKKVFAPLVDTLYKKAFAPLVDTLYEKGRGAKIQGTFREQFNLGEIQGTFRFAARRQDVLARTLTGLPK
jgi:hypothetical protein